MVWFERFSTSGCPAQPGQFQRCSAHTWVCVRAGDARLNHQKIRQPETCNFDSHQNQRVTPSSIVSSLSFLESYIVQYSRGLRLDLVIAHFGFFSITGEYDAGKSQRGPEIIFPSGGAQICSNCDLYAGEYGKYGPYSPDLAGRL